MAERRFDGDTVLGRMRGQPGGRELLQVAAEHGDVELVGGAVRDLLLGAEPRELDVIVARGAGALAGTLAGKLGTVAEISEHERFGTALVSWPQGRIDIATRRAERYPAPGALPEVREGTPAEDLLRRDFTVNALAVALAGPERGRLCAPERALADLADGVLRVMHDESFRDDPTRLLRLARYRVRLRFAIDPHTSGLAREATEAHALRTISGARQGAELRLALAEPAALEALGAMDELGLLAELHPRLRFDGELARAALGLLPEDGRPDLLLLAALGLPLVLRADHDPAGELRALLDRLEFSAGDRDRALSAALAGVSLVEGLGQAASAAQLYAVVDGAPPEGVALAGAQASPAGARRWLQEVRHVRLRIDGRDLLAAGVHEGPDIGRRLDDVLRARLDELVPDEREAQLRAALGRS